MKSVFFAALLLASTCPAWSQSAPVPVAPSAAAPATDAFAERDAAEHARIRQARAAEESRAAALESQCYARFAVNDCLIAVRAHKRDVLSDLRRQEVSLNDARRKRRAAEQFLRQDDRAARSSTP